MIGKRANEQEEQEDIVNLRESGPDIEKVSQKIKQTAHEETKEIKLPQENKFNPTLEVIEEEEPNFDNRNRSFPRHPLDDSYDSKIEEESIRMSKSTLRQIKSTKRSRSSHRIGRASISIDTRSIAERGISKLLIFFSGFKNFMSTKYYSLKDWMWPIDLEEANAKNKKRASSEAKPKEKKIVIEEEKKMDEDSDIIEPHQVEPQARSIAKIISSKQPKHIDHRFIYENDSEPDVEQPSEILQRQIDKLIEEELKLKQVEEQITKELKELRQEVTTEDISNIKYAAEDKAERKRKNKKSKKKKTTKTHHDMRRMKQEKIKKIINKDFKELENSPKARVIVKDYKSDHDSVQRTSNNQQKVKYKDENVQINIEKLESSGVKEVKIDKDQPVMRSEEVNEIEVKLSEELIKPNSTSPRNECQNPLQKLLSSPVQMETSFEEKKSPKHKVREDRMNKFHTEKPIKHHRDKLKMRDYSEASERSENQRYRSVERTKAVPYYLEVSKMKKVFSASKYSISHYSENEELSSQNPDNSDAKVKCSKEVRIEVPQLKVEAKAIKSDSSDEVQVNDDKQQPFSLNANNYEVESPTLQKKAERQSNLERTKSLSKNYDEIIKESLDFATYLKTQTTEVKNLVRDSDLSDAARVRKHVEDLLKSPKIKDLKQNSAEDSKKTVRQTLEFILSESEDSFEAPDEQEIKESIIKFEGQTIVKQSESLLKSMNDAILKAKLCLSNHDFSNPLLHSIQIIKNEKAIPEEEVEKRFGDELDELIDDDFVRVTPKNSRIIEQNKDALETLGDELNQLYENYGENLFNYEEHSSPIDTPRGYTMIPSNLDELKNSDKNINLQLSSNNKDDILKCKNKDIESPFSIANDLSNPQFSNNKINFYPHENEEKYKEETSLQLNEDLVKIRVSSADNTPAREKKKARIPPKLKDKLKATVGNNLVVRNYSLDKFKAKDDSSCGMDRLKKNLEKFRNNPLFKRGSDSERSLRSLRSHES